jgi:pentatricopeptide repeat protein
VDDPIATKTLAELYLSQGNAQKALEIYHEMLRRDPSNPEIMEAIEKLKGVGAADTPGPPSAVSKEPPASERIRVLKGWQDRIRAIRRERSGGEIP